MLSEIWETYGNYFENAYLTVQKGLNATKFGVWWRDRAEVLQYDVDVSFGFFSWEKEVVFEMCTINLQKVQNATKMLLG